MVDILGSIAGAAGDIAKTVTDAVGGAVSAVGDAVKPVTDAAGDVIKYHPAAVIANALIDIVPKLAAIAGALADLTKTMSGISGTISSIQSILAPFSGLDPLLNKIRDAVNDVNNLDLDKAIQAPNLDIDVAHSLSRALSVPFIGEIVRNEVNLAWMKRYQSVTGRGFPTALDQLHYLTEGGVTPTSMISELTSRLPDFFLTNEHSDVSKFDKGYEAAVRQSKTHRPSKN